MADDNTDNLDAVLTLLDLAHADLAATLAEDGSLSGDGLREACTGHLENLLWACEQAGESNLHRITEALLAQVGNEATAIDAGTAALLLDWFGDARIYVEEPNDELAGLLLQPLSESVRAELLPLLGSDGEVTPAASGEAFPEAEAATDAAEDPVVTASEERPEEDPFADTEFDEDDLLCMLAWEMKEVAPELDALALQLSEAETSEASLPLVEEYLEILGRVETISVELDLQGLNYVCGFINQNLALIAASEGDARLEAIDVLRGWPRVVIDHLLHPEDDSRCLAVVDYLESEAWPQPVPYRELRTLIEGLARTVEVSSGFVAELRAVEATAEDVSLEVSDDTSAELIDAFFAESPGHAETLSKLTESIIRGVDVQVNVEAAQRVAHTLKGSGNLIGARGLANLSHHLEDIFEYIARRQFQPPSALALTMQEASDLIEAMIEALQGMTAPPPDAQRILQDVLDWANRIDSGQIRESDYRGAERAPVPAARPEIEADLELESDPGDQPDPQAEPVAAVSEQTVRVPLRLLDNIFRLVSETAVTAAQIQERLNRLEDGDKLIRNNDGHLQQQRYELENLVGVRSMAARHRGQAMGSEGDFDALEMDEYDEFYSATHAFIEAVADSREILRGFTGEVYELDSLFVEQQRLNKELQQLVVTTRLMPVSTIAARLQRTVRQVCRTTGKQAELSIDGQDLLLDGDVLNKLADPLMHMLRNAVDHGIEASDARVAAGKPPAGRISLEFVQQGNNVVVNCSDDGRGLDYERIRARAIERGLLSEDDARDKDSLALLILQTGFSTSEKVTQVSGRGVGMDVVSNAIQALNGTMKVSDGVDAGTRVSLRLPITLLTSHCLLAGVGKDNLYAIPTLSLTQILSPGSGFIENLGDALSYRLEDETYPAYTLNTLIGSADRQMLDNLDQYNVLLVQTANGVVAVVVERVVTSYDLVVKNIGAYVKSISGIAGVSMLGNGEVVPVLDLASMLQALENADLSIGRAEAQSSGAEEIKLTRVLIVDDSLSVRNSLGQLMRDSGYEALLARDGLEAINIIRAERPDIVFTDLEMPRMNGLDLISYIRNSSDQPGLPVVMITSRNMAKHRHQAEAAGVNRFIAKPFIDDEILECIETELSLMV